jgi:hypothetical protein
VAKQRASGPSTEEVYTVTLRRNDATGIVVVETWAKPDTRQPHRMDGPAMIARDYETGIVTHEMWCQDGVVHRADGPANIMRKADTGRVYFSEWIDHGKKIKPSKQPARPSRAQTMRSSPKPT